MTPSIFKLALAACLALLCASAIANAQAISGDLVGTIQDATGAPIPNAAVTAINTGTNAKYTATTNSSGEYRIGNLPPANYVITASAPGFAPATLKNVPVQLNQTIPANLTPQVGSVTGLQERQVNHAAAPAGEGKILSLFGSGPAIGGQRPTNNNFTIDGVDNNSKSVTGPTVFVPNDAVAFNTIVRTGTLPDSAQSIAGYVLGPEDQITVRVLDLDEFNAQNLTPVRIDMRGNIRLPLVGRLHAAGLTVEKLESEIAVRLSNLMNDPEVTVAVAEFRSHPVTVLGAVKTAGVLQITGRKTLFEVLSLAGGLNPDAGNTVKITRRVDSGPLPLPNVVRDPSGDFFVGQLNVRAVMEAKNPLENIDVLPNDVVTVPKADLVYVVGGVKRSGGFVLSSEKEQITVLQALSLAEGLDRDAAPKKARILRPSAVGAERIEIAVDLKRILDGSAQDVALRANDILFVPTNAAKSVGIRALETAVQMATGIAIYRL